MTTPTQAQIEALIAAAAPPAPTQAQIEAAAKAMFDREYGPAKVDSVIPQFDESQKYYWLPMARAALTAAAQVGEQTSLEQLKSRIDTRLNDYLCEMKEGYDDSITGFNEAWDIVRKVFADTAAAQVGEPFKDGDALVTALIWEVDRAVKQAAKNEGRYDTTIRHILNEHLGGKAAAQVGGPSRNAKLEIEQLTRELIEKEAATIERCVQVAEQWEREGYPGDFKTLLARIRAAQAEHELYTPQMLRGFLDETIERCAQVADSYVKIAMAMPTSVIDTVCRDIADAIRKLAKEPVYGEHLRKLRDEA